MTAPNTIHLTAAEFLVRSGYSLATPTLRTEQNVVVTASADSAWWHGYAVCGGGSIEVIGPGEAYAYGGGNATAHDGDAHAWGTGNATSYRPNARARAFGGGVETDSRGTRHPVDHPGIPFDCLYGDGWLRVGCEMHHVQGWIANADEIDAHWKKGIAHITRALAQSCLDGSVIYTTAPKPEQETK